MPPCPPRDQMLRCRLTESERARLQAFARASDKTESQVVREALKRVIPDLSEPLLVTVLRHEVIE